MIKKNYKISLAIFLLLLVIIFIIQNYSVIEIKFLLWSLQISKIAIVLISFLAGVAAGLIISYLKEKVEKNKIIQKENVH